jgi:hypothetical protein
MIRDAILKLEVLDSRRPQEVFRMIHGDAKRPRGVGFGQVGAIWN